MFFFSCRPANTVSDVDGNTYRTVRIGNQLWMAENLRVTHYRDGSAILQLPANEAWRKAEDGAWCDYFNERENGKTYGHLYNWLAVNDVRGIAPAGWRVPSQEDIAELITYLKGDTIAASGLKEAGAAHWIDAGSNASGDSGFDALPGGYRSGIDGSFHTLKSNGYWWAATRSFELFAWSPRIFGSFADVDRDKSYYTYGFSVRCIKE
nr:fibrobacter succinogenes major paralogous domain-containing protein [Hufsiella ginkgonis]